MVKTIDHRVWYPVLSDIHWGLGADSLWTGGLVFPQSYMAMCLIMPRGPPPAASWLWAGGWGDGKMGMEAEAQGGPQSQSQLDPGSRVLTRRPTPHSERRSRAHIFRWLSSIYRQTRGELPCTHNTQCALIWFVVVIVVFLFCFCFFIERLII